MKLLERDMKKFYYGIHRDSMMIVDEHGHPTGERSQEYEEPVEAYGTFSTASGRATEREFGTFINYDYIIHLEAESCPFDETAAIWLPGGDPTGDPDGRVTMISDLASHIAVAVKKIR